MNEGVLYALSEIAMTLAGFSGIAAAFRLRGKDAWTATELRVLWFLIIDSFLVVLLALLPIPLQLADLSGEVIWAIGSVLLAVWFAAGNFLALQGVPRKKVLKQLASLPVIVFFFTGMTVFAWVMAAALFLSAFDILLPRGQAMYVGGLIVLLAFAAIEFLFFIGRASASKPD